MVVVEMVMALLFSFLFFLLENVNAIVRNLRSIHILKNFPNYFNVFHDSHFLELKSNPRYYVSTGSTSTITSLVITLYFIAHILGFRYQVMPFSLIELSI
jgi:hypothetical protein